MARLRPLVSKALFLGLSALLFFASYRPATCLISILSMATEGGSDVGFSTPAKERPRPTRQQSLTRVDRVDDARVQKKSPDAEAAAPKALPFPGTSDGAAAARARIAQIQPDYLRPNLSSAARSPHAPPG